MTAPREPKPTVSFVVGVGSIPIYACETQVEIIPACPRRVCERLRGSPYPQRSGVGKVLGGDGTKWNRLLVFRSILRLNVLF
jgi:hypothetical protein